MKARQHPPAPFDLIAGGLLLAFGFVLLTSASLEVSWRATGDALYYVKKQLLFAGIGLSVMLILSQIPLQSGDGWPPCSASWRWRCWCWY